MTSDFQVHQKNKRPPSGLGEVPDVDMPEGLKEYLQSLHQYIKTISGDVNPGNKDSYLERAVTFKDLHEVGLTVPRGTTQNGGYQGGSTPLPIIVNPKVPPVRPVENPITPSGLTVVGLKINTLLTWDAIGYYGHAYSEVWRSATNNIGTATLIARASGRIFVDPIGEGGAQYFYWIRFVNELDDISDWNDSAGTSATTSMIGNDAVAALAADKLFAVTGTIAEAIIGEGHINNLMIGDVIQSDTYSAGLSGWKINKLGECEFNSATFRGTVDAATIIGSDIYGGRIDGTEVIGADILVKTEAWTVLNDSKAYAGYFEERLGVDITPTTFTPSGGAAYKKGIRKASAIKSYNYSVLTEFYRFRDNYVKSIEVWAVFLWTSGSTPAAYDDDSYMKIYKGTTQIFSVALNAAVSGSNYYLSKSQETGDTYRRYIIYMLINGSGIGFDGDSELRIAAEIHSASAAMPSETTITMNEINIRVNNSL